MVTWLRARATTPRALALSALAICMLVAVASPSRAAAQETTAAAPSDATVLEARTLFEEGVRLSRAERWVEAREAFRRSAELVERPRTFFNLAIALDRLGRLHESITAIDRYLAISDVTADDADRREAARMRLSCERRLVTLVVRAAPLDAALEIDGEPVATDGAERRLTWDPGDHVVTLTAPGHAPWRESIAMPPGSVIERAVTLEPVAGALEPPPEDTRAGSETSALGDALIVEPPRQTSLLEDPVFWIVIGAVAVAAGVGIGVGVHFATEPQPYGGSTGLRF